MMHLAGQAQYRWSRFNSNVRPRNRNRVYRENSATVHAMQASVYSFMLSSSNVSRGSCRAETQTKQLWW